MLKTPRSFVSFVVTFLAVTVALAACPTGEGTGDGDGDNDAGPDDGFKSVSFPEGFAFGVAQNQYVAEGDKSAIGGDPIDSNWSRWINQGKAAGGQLNLDGNGFTTKYAEDIQRAKDLGVDTFRVSIDWARIEPAPGAFDDAELAHIVDILTEIDAQGLKPVLTLWNWVMPVWVQSTDPAGPFGAVDLLSSTDRSIVDGFEAFVRYVVPEVKGLVDTYAVINEPFSVISGGYLSAEMPPERLLSVDSAAQVAVNLAFMHGRGFDVIKELDDEDADGDGANSFVGMTKTATPVYPTDPDNADEVFAAEQIDYAYNKLIMRALVDGELDVNIDGEIDAADTTPPEGVFDELKDRLEFIGIQYFGPLRVKENPILSNFAPLYGQPVTDARDYDATLPHTGSGREIRAAALRETLETFSAYGIPMIITEGGAPSNQPWVWEQGDPDVELTPQVGLAPMHLLEHMWEIGRALERGLDIRGYYYYGIADTFDWGDGRWQQYGLYGVDFADSDYPRTKRDVAECYERIVQGRGIDEALWSAFILEAYPNDQRPEAERGLTTSEPVFR